MISRRATRFLLSLSFSSSFLRHTQLLQYNTFRIVVACAHPRRSPFCLISTARNCSRLIVQRQARRITRFHRAQRSLCIHACLRTCLGATRCRQHGDRRQLLGRVPRVECTSGLASSGIRCCYFHCAGRVETFVNQATYRRPARLIALSTQAKPARLLADVLI